MHHHHAHHHHLAGRHRARFAPPPAVEIRYADEPAAPAPDDLAGAVVIEQTPDGPVVEWLPNEPSGPELEQIIAEAEGGP